MMNSSNDGVESVATNATRKYLTRTIKAMVALALLAVVYVFFDGLGPTPQRHDANQTIIDLSGLQHGQILRIETGPLPVWILARNETMLAQLHQANSLLADPESKHSIQPAELDPAYRSLRPEYFVFIPLFSWISSSDSWGGLVFVTHMQAKDDKVYIAGGLRQWHGGFRDSSQQALYFDYAGRVYAYHEHKWLRRVDNLAVPYYEFIDKNRLRIIWGDLPRRIRQPRND